tara:strand:- start:568 stop:1644 length:1077 start_codon:yes stop_codon:yes gene_type:complete
MPKSILLWRAILQWLGGIGIIIMAITLMPIMNVGGMQLFKISNNDSSEKILPKSKEIALRLIYIYTSLTILCGLTYMVFGMSFFDSLTHSMTTIATGGFSNYNESIAFFNSASIEISAMIFIILGSLPFITYIKFISGNKKIIFTDLQIRTFFKIIIISIIILSTYLILSGSSEMNLRSIFFNVISILTGTGYVNAEFDTWGSFTLVIFLSLMFIGGCAGSTTCGVKVFRIQILYLFVVNQLKRIIYPKGVFVLKYDQNPIDDKFISSIISFIYMYLVIFFILMALLSLTGLDFITSISGAATSISNVGPGLGSIIGPNGDFSSLPDSSKWILTLGMILGRLELFAILVLFLPSFWKN